jgi:hypothetical protein
MTEIKKSQAVEPFFNQKTVPDHPEKKTYYRIRFREQGQEYTAQSTEPDLVKGDIVMTETEHCPEPVTDQQNIRGYGTGCQKRLLLYHSSPCNY